MAKKLIKGKNDFESICIREGKEYLLSEWSNDRNTFAPDSVGYGTSKKVWWTCSDCGNIYQATPYHRLEGTACPECGRRKRGETRLRNRIKNMDTFGDKYPGLLKEWDYEKNVNVDPFSIAPNYTIKVWWRCEKGHSWEAITPNRIKGRGCPYCSNKKIIVGENDFASTTPELLDSWDYEKNRIKPTELTSGSMKKVFWKCPKGHSWECTIRARKICGCPVCGNKKIVVGENDLATTNPELVSEWDFEKNEITPQEVVRGSEVYVWWKCEFGHSWRAKITNRVHGTNCPECRKYIKTSFQEQAIFYYVKKNYPDAINSYCDKGFEIDVYIPCINTGVEYDGQRWHKDIKKDIKKNNKCKDLGIRLIRVREKGCPPIDDSFDTCIFMENNHDVALEKCLIDLMNQLNIRNIDINLDRDRLSIYENYCIIQKENSIAEKFPELVKEWHPYKNKSLTPYMLPYGTQKKVWWQCGKGHEWQAEVQSRTGKTKAGCPVCSNRKIVEGINDLTTTAPEILRYWDYELNSQSPKHCGLTATKRYWWKCEKGHSWKDTAMAIKKNLKPCPICASRKIISGVNDFATVHRDDLLKEWDYKKNEIDPSKIASGKEIDVWWICSVCGTSWKARLSNRVNGNKTGCPKCADKKRKISRREYIRSSGSSLESLFPEIAKEWHPIYNNNLQFGPDQVGAKSAELVWWKCSACGNEWRTAIRQRTSNQSRCPICAQRDWNKKHGRRVINVDTGEVFETVTSASKKYNCSSGNIGLCCQGKTKTACGYHWKYC